MPTTLLQTMTAQGIKALEPRPKQYEVGDPLTRGLSLRVLPSGAKRWSFRYRKGPRWSRVSLGEYPGVSLKDARDLAAEHRRAIQVEGRDPSQEKREALEADVDTFEALCDHYIERHAKPKKRSWKVDRRMLANEIPRSWKTRPPNEISRREIRLLIETKGDKYPVQANRLRALLHKLFNFALEYEAVDFNPVSGTPRPGRERQRERVLTDEEIRRFWSATETMDAPMRAWWRLRLITAQRAAEVNSMRWEDLDLENRVWIVPAGVVKNKTTHRVPLSDLALEAISELPRHSEYVLAGARGKRQQGQASRSIPIPDFEGHDLRRTAATNMAMAKVPRLHISKVLNHADRGVTSIYERHSYESEKRAALDTWARKLRSILQRTSASQVVQFPAS